MFYIVSIFIFHLSSNTISYSHSMFFMSYSMFCFYWRACFLLLFCMFYFICFSIQFFIIFWFPDSIPSTRVSTIIYLLCMYCISISTQLLLARMSLTVATLECLLCKHGLLPFLLPLFSLSFPPWQYCSCTMFRATACVNNFFPWPMMYTDDVCFWSLTISLTFAQHSSLSSPLFS
jgi:hypothetical protein